MLAQPKRKYINPRYGQAVIGPPGSVEDVMSHLGLGPNGALMYCLEYLEANIEWWSCTLITSLYLGFSKDPAKFISTLLMSLNSMLLMGLPHVNLLSKADLLKQFESKLLYNLEFYTDVLDLSYLLEALDDAPGMRKYKKLNAAIISMVEDYALVSFQPLDVHRDESLLRVKNLVDKANGYIYGAGEERSINSLLACAVGAESHQAKIEKDINPYVRNPL
ncbi:unnamed protein product [Hermetia illucens]|uniref:GPN-loop GTPase 2 n=1 Tax=Hermetia illucens TaxID=343691 RepID=A0A7R8UJ39_HERIL|nr:unnamed protein product [Hermetia illucens]